MIKRDRDVWDAHTELQGPAAQDLSQGQISPCPGLSTSLSTLLETLGTCSHPL